MVSLTHGYAVIEPTAEKVYRPGGVGVHPAAPALGVTFDSVIIYPATSTSSEAVKAVTSTVLDVNEVEYNVKEFTVGFVTSVDAIVHVSDRDAEMFPAASRTHA